MPQLSWFFQGICVDLIHYTSNSMVLSKTSKFRSLCAFCKDSLFYTTTFIDIPTYLAYLEAQTGFCMNSSSFSFSRPLRTLFWGVLPGNKSLVIVSSGLSGNHTSNAQMDTKLANGSHNSFPSTLIPDLKVPENNNNNVFMDDYKCVWSFFLP